MALHRQQREVFDLLRELSGQSRVLTVPRVFVRLCGGWEEAAMLSQILYWSDPDKRGGWFYKTHAEWSRELELSEKQVRRVRDNLVLLGFVETKIARVASSLVSWYRPTPAAIVTEYEKHLPKRAGEVPERAGGAVQTDSSLNSSSPRVHTSARPGAREDGTQENLSVFSDEERAEMDRLWNEAQSSPIGQLMLGFMKRGGEAQ